MGTLMLGSRNSPSRVVTLIAVSQFVFRFQPELDSVAVRFPRVSPFLEGTLTDPRHGYNG